MRERITADSNFTEKQKSDAAILDHFRLLQSTDNLSLLTCVNFSKPAHLLHPLPLRDGGYAEVQVQPRGTRQFKLDPYPFAEPSKTFPFPPRHIAEKRFSSPAELQERFNNAPVQMLSVTVTAN